MGGPAQPMPQDMAPAPPPMAPPQMNPEMARQAGVLEQAEMEARATGEQLGAEYAQKMMAGIDGAQSTEDLINALRGNDRPLDARRDELAGYVGQSDAEQTPESVLAMVQPVIMMTEEGIMDSGIGNLMQQITGEVDMMTESGQPTDMGQGVGSLMMAGAPEAPAPQNFRQGGEVAYLQDGSNPIATAPSDRYFQRATELLKGGVISLPPAKSVREYYDELSPVYKDLLGDVEEMKRYNRGQTFFDIAKAGLAFASGRDPETGQLVTNQPLGAQLATAVKELPGAIQGRAAQQREFDLAVNQAALQGAVARSDEDRKLTRDMALLREQLGTDLITAGIKADTTMLEGEIVSLYNTKTGEFAGAYNTSIPAQGRAVQQFLSMRDEANKPIYEPRTKGSAEQVAVPKPYELIFDDGTSLIATSRTGGQGGEYVIEGGVTLTPEQTQDAQIYAITPDQARERRAVNRRLEEVDAALKDFNEGREITVTNPDTGKEETRRMQEPITFNTGATIYGRADRVKNIAELQKILQGDDLRSRQLRETFELDPDKTHFSIEEITSAMPGFTKGKIKTRQLDTLDSIEMHMTYIDEFGDEQTLNVIDASLDSLGPIENVEEWFANVTGDFFETSEAQMAASQMRQYLRTIAFMGKVAFIANPRIPVAELGPAAALLNDPDKSFFQNAELAASNWNLLNEQLNNLYLNNLSILSDRNAPKEDIDAAMHSIRQIKMLKNMMGPVSERYMAFRRGDRTGDVGYTPNPGGLD